MSIKKYIFSFFIFCLILVLASCGNKSIEIVEESLLCNFADSVKIIRTLIETKSVSKILEDSSKQDDIDFLINNLSPAEFAFESEVLNCTMPALVYFYENQIHDQNVLDEIAEKYKDRIKIVLIDAMQFPKISQDAAIDIYPTAILISNRQEIGRTQEITCESIKQLVA